MKKENIFHLIASIELVMFFWASRSAWSFCTLAGKTVLDFFNISLILSRWTPKTVLYKSSVDAISWSLSYQLNFTSTPRKLVIRRNLLDIFRNFSCAIVRTEKYLPPSCISPNKRNQHHGNLHVLAAKSVNLLIYVECPRLTLYHVLHTSSIPPDMADIALLPKPLRRTAWCAQPSGSDASVLWRGFLFSKSKSPTRARPCVLKMFTWRFASIHWLRYRT